MILVIDNYDSFVYNLVQYLGQLGVEAVVWRNDDPHVTGDQLATVIDDVLVDRLHPSSRHAHVVVDLADLPRLAELGIRVA